MDGLKSQDAGISEEIETILLEHTENAGLSAGVASSKSKIHRFDVGLANILEDRAVDSTCFFGIGSITKVFVAVVVLQLVEEGKLRLSDIAGQLLDKEVLLDVDGAYEASIEQLLGHRAGIDSWEDDPEWIAHGRGRFVRPDHIWTKTEPLDYIRRPRKTAPAAGQWYYSNTNYTLLGLIVEKITKDTAEAQIRSRIIERLGLNHTYLEGFEQPRSGHVTGRYHFASAAFKKNAGIYPSAREINDHLIEACGYNMSTSWLAGGMISQVSDLLKLAIALRKGQLLQPASMQLMQRWTAAREDLECGHGLFRMRLRSGYWIGHSGGVLGFSAGLWWHEETDCAICVLGNVGFVHAETASKGVKAVVSTSRLPDLALRLVAGTS